MGWTRTCKKNYFSGTAKINGKLVYVPQQAWIMNLTLKDKITFMQENNDKKYKEI